jgi:hypothetical protein
MAMDSRNFRMLAKIPGPHDFVRYCQIVRSVLTCAAKLSDSDSFAVF